MRQASRGNRIDRAWIDDTNKAHIKWMDGITTEGPLDNVHIWALLNRAHREGKMEGELPEQPR